MAIPAIIATGASDISAICEIEQMGYMILRKPVRPAKLCAGLSPRNFCRS